MINCKLSRFFVLSAIAVFMSSFSLLGEQPSAEKIQYRAEIIRTSYGIPHITADNFASLGFGEGYAAAEDHVCNIAHGLVVARGERTKYYGKGTKNKNLLSDIVIRALEIPDRAEQEFKAQSKENQLWLQGYTDGFNKYIRETGVKNITSWCKGASWVREITAIEVFSRFQVLAQSAPRMSGMITAAQPPKTIVSFSVEQQNFEDEIDTLKSKHLGSNGWAFGKETTETGRGLLLGNPHYPWSGTSRFWEKHLTIPGKLNIYGAQLIGAPGVSIGFNEKVGWTHTVSNSERVVFYSLKLVAGDPTSYLYDGKPRKMIEKKVDVPLKSGKVESHSVWFSHYGPVVALPGAAWSDSFALTMRDANFRNQNLLSQWKAMDMAKSMDDLKMAHKKWDAMPWVNTMATSFDGRAVFIDGSNVGRLSPEAIKLWRERSVNDPRTKSFYNRMGLILLDGSDSRFEWTTHPDARVAGVVPFSEKPQLDRTDYIFNANDSYWLSNISEPLTGFSPLYGSDDSARTVRTRMNAIMLTDTSKSGIAGADGKISLKEIQQTLFSNRSLTAELLLDDLVAACLATPVIQIAAKDYDLTASCIVLKGYNKRLDLDSKGAVLFREWISLYSFADTLKKGRLFSVAFDKNDPINTPRTLADKTLALENLAKATLTLKNAGLKLDVSLAETQFAYRGKKKIALHGGKGIEGVANIIGQRDYDTKVKQTRGTKLEGSKYLTDKGYPITFGSSFILSLSYTDDGPIAEAFLTYSQSGDPSSDHYTDQTQLFSKKQWRAILFKRDDVLKDAKSTLVLEGTSQN